MCHHFDMDSICTHPNSLHNLHLHKMKWKCNKTIFRAGFIIQFSEAHKIFKNIKYNTVKSLGTCAIVFGNSIYTCATIKAGRWPTFIPIRLTLTTSIAINAITRIWTVNILKLIEMKSFISLSSAQLIIQLIYLFKSSMHTPKTHGLLEQPNDASLPLIIRTNSTQLINM